MSIHYSLPQIPISLSNHTQISRMKNQLLHRAQDPGRIQPPKLPFLKVSAVSRAKLTTKNAVKTTRQRKGLVPSAKKFRGDGNTFGVLGGEKIPVKIPSEELKEFARSGDTICYL